MVKIEFYVPEADLDKVKKAMFAQGAGVLQGYQQCAWQTEGTGQFIPDINCNPHIGQPETLTFVKEFKVEMICEEDKLAQVIQALKMAHPYEVPAYFIHASYQGVS